MIQGMAEDLQQRRRQIMKGNSEQAGDYLWGLPWRRIEMGLSQAEVAEASGVSQKQISRYELHKVKPHPGTLRKLARALKCRIKDLLTRHIED